MLASYALGVATPLLLVAAAADYATPYVRRLAVHGPRFEVVSGAALLALAVALLVQIPASAGALRFHEANAGPAEVAVESLEKGGAEKLVFFHSEHCPACRAMEAYLPALERACASAGWSLVRVDVEQPANGPLLERFAVRAVPTTSLLDSHGREIRRLVGYQEPDVLRELLEREGQLACAAAVTGAPLGGEGSDAATCDVDRMC